MEEIKIANSGEPIRFMEFEPLIGFATEAKQKGEKVEVWTRLALSSDDLLFHRIAENFESVINRMAQQAGILVRLDQANMMLLVMKADNSAELWLDTAAVTLFAMAKSNVEAGTFLYESDFADITAMSFPCVNIEPTDRLFCIFRVGWRFGLAFDLNRGAPLDIESYNRILGTLYRDLRYRDLYAALSNQALFDRLVNSGWFPFIEIISGEFKNILKHCEAGFDMNEVDAEVLDKFDEARLQKMLARWIIKPHFAAKEKLLREAVEAYIDCKPISAIKILLTEIEGILRDSYRDAHNGKSAKIKVLLKFAVKSAEQKAGQPNTLLLPGNFGHYLETYTFADFDPVNKTGKASSRHAVGHGAAEQDSYTMARALQAILTLDQLAFYT